MTSLIQLVPHLPPDICGVGDYATLVGSKIEELHADLRCAYLACGHRPSAVVAETAVQRDITGRCEPKSLWQAVGELAAGQPAVEISIVLHYSGYGYAPSGAPTWLAEAIEHRPSQLHGCRIVTFFHELFATGRLWERSFWMGGLQKSIARRIARASDTLITNRSQSARWLEQAAGRPPGSVPHSPVPSNVGEMDQLPQWQSRSPSAVLFGSARFKQEFLNRRAKETITLCRRLDLRIIREIGAATKFDSAPFRAAGIPVESMGWLTADEVSRVFQCAKVALVAYYPGYAAKSGVLAAAAAHGTPPIFLHEISGRPDGLNSGEHYIELNAALADSAEEIQQRLPAASRSIHQWYAPHASIRHAELISSFVGASPAHAIPAT